VIFTLANTPHTAEFYEKFWNKKEAAKHFVSLTFPVTNYI
jgi:hypothetical protein